MPTYEYVKPGEALSPKKHWRLHRVLYDGGAGGWSAAEGQWEDNGVWENRLAIRWNGTPDAQIGNPQSRGLPTWFIVPEELADALREAISVRQEQSGESTN